MRWLTALCWKQDSMWQKRGRQHHRIFHAFQKHSNQGTANRQLAKPTPHPSHKLGHVCNTGGECSTSLLFWVARYPEWSRQTALRSSTWKRGFDHREVCGGHCGGSRLWLFVVVLWWSSCFRPWWSFFVVVLWWSCGGYICSTFRKRTTTC